MRRKPRRPDGVADLSDWGRAMAAAFKYPSKKTDDAPVDTSHAATAKDVHSTLGAESEPTGTATLNDASEELNSTPVDTLDSGNTWAGESTGTAQPGIEPSAAGSGSSGDTLARSSGSGSTSQPANSVATKSGSKQAAASRDVKIDAALVRAVAEAQAGFASARREVYGDPVERQKELDAERDAVAAEAVAGQGGKPGIDAARVAAAVTEAAMAEQVRCGLNIALLCSDLANAGFVVDVNGAQVCLKRFVVRQCAVCCIHLSFPGYT